MKVLRKSIPMDQLCVEKGRNKIHIFTHRSTIVLNAAPEGCVGADLRLNFEELYQLIVKQSKRQSNL